MDKFNETIEEQETHLMDPKQDKVIQPKVIKPNKKRISNEERVYYIPDIIVNPRVTTRVYSKSGEEEPHTTSSLIKMALSTYRGYRGYKDIIQADKVINGLKTEIRNGQHCLVFNHEDYEFVRLIVLDYEPFLEKGTLFVGLFKLFGSEEDDGDKL